MPKLLTILVILSSLVWALPNYKLGYATSDGARMREQPGAQGAVVASVHRGDSLAILSRQKGWLEVVPRHAWVLSSNLVEGKIGPQGADLLLEPRKDSVKLGHIEAAEVEGVMYRGKTFTMLHTPFRFRYWVAEHLVGVRGLVIRPNSLASPYEVAVSDKDYRRLAALKRNGLRFLVLPTKTLGKPKLELADSSDRFGPHYQVRYQVGPEWFLIGGATSGLGGADLGEPLYIVGSELFGSVIVGTENYGMSKNFMGLVPEIRDGSGVGGEPYPLTVVFSCSPGLPESLIRQAIESLRAVRL